MSLGTPERIVTGPTSTFVAYEFPKINARTALSAIARGREIAAATPLIAMPQLPSPKICSRV